VMDRVASPAGVVLSWLSMDLRKIHRSTMNRSNFRKMVYAEHEVNLSTGQVDAYRRYVLGGE